MSEPLTQPDDDVLRVAREIAARWTRWQLAYADSFAGCDTHGGPVPPSEAEIAGLIGTLLTEREREWREGVTKLRNWVITGMPDKGIKLLDSTTGPGDDCPSGDGK